MKIGNKFYHVSLDFTVSKGTIIEIKPSFLSGLTLVTIATETETITDYETNFSKKYPSIAHYWKH